MSGINLICATKLCLKHYNVTSKDIRHNNRMGDITMVLVGDFRQTLLVIPRITRSDEMQVCLKSLYQWNDIQRLGLTNMRVQLNGDTSAQQVADILLPLGNGVITPDNQDGCIAIQSIRRIVKTQQEIKEEVFPNVEQHFIGYLWLRQRAFLARRNEDVNVMKNQL
ncbi:hypothetical protein AVEN_167474-1 [Araneus ventricosus]|uniref:ATP-dependent DNA helicase n=1 Tax=Araneus ventricosus TaxID=182803 RepID=A0A4Y2IDJ3_ARAVE|nr:hypothetical protein AVEN_167474-1 [Araneus ventricosus]